MLVDRLHERRITALSLFGTGLAFAASAATLANVTLYDDVLPPDLILGSLGGDVVSLLASLGAIACLVAVRRGAASAWLPWVGLQAHVLYSYALYAFGLVFTPLYPVYLAIVGLSAYALVIFARAVHPSVLKRVAPDALPRRTMGVALFVIAGGFAAVWTTMLWLAIVRDLGLPAATVIVIDLTIALPFLVVVGVMLWRRSPMGYVLAPGVFAMSAAITLGVAAAELVRPVLGGGFLPVNALPYLTPAVVCAAFAFVAYRRIAPALRHQNPEWSEP